MTLGEFLREFTGKLKRVAEAGPGYFPSSGFGGQRFGGQAHPGKHTDKTTKNTRKNITQARNHIHKKNKYSNKNNYSPKSLPMQRFD